MILRNSKTGKMAKVYQQRDSRGGRYYYLVDACGQIIATRADAMLAGRGSEFKPVENYTHDDPAQMWFRVHNLITH